MWSQIATTLFIGHYFGHYRLFRTFYRTFWSFRTIYRSFFVLSDNIMQLIQIISEKSNFSPIYYRKFKKSIIFALAKNAYYYMHPSFQEEPTVMFAPRFLFTSSKDYTSSTIIFALNSFAILAKRFQLDLRMSGSFQTFSKCFNVACIIVGPDKSIPAS